MQTQTKKARSTRITTQTRRIWTRGYRPFIFGGDVWYCLGVNWPCRGPFRLGKGFRGWAAEAPNGTVFIAEDSTGAIVGNAPTEYEALVKVRQDITMGKKKVMVAQVAQAAAEMKTKTVTMREPDFFWNAICKNKS